MAGTAYRQKLGDPLYDAQYDGVNDAHNTPVVSCFWIIEFAL
jgi:hypothetical protein